MPETAMLLLTEKQMMRLLHWFKQADMNKSGEDEELRYYIQLHLDNLKAGHAAP